MTAIAHPVSQQEQLKQRLAELTSQGAQGFDPVRFRYMEALWQRASQQREGVRRILLKKLQVAVDSYTVDYEQLKQQSAQPLQALAQHPQIRDLQALHQQSNFKTVIRRAQRLASASKEDAGHLLALLTEQLSNLKFTQEEQQQSSAIDNLFSQQDQETVATLTGLINETAPGTTQPVKSLAAGRRLQLLTRKHYDDTLITQALLRAPEDPGPLNAHKLLISALSTMRDLSPKYVSRFAILGESLLWLEEMDRREPAVAKPDTDKPVATKKKTGTRKSKPKSTA
ncbi:DUF2894 domain-containing protein [Ketobacter sp. MCCC 1A13808]|uniref:DUF2894 domain-containing protein n=1 Tax=Ketobacter sp. MCCC 1A13808 TaxID=2602738 RepID=UPI000F220FC5|nr:DUF2894 domain-containing protein [Ketobacter sp. MCCC 1A13808]MVF12079.1 DUF2894 domain-containing protein [Ketobacter sp. MCCC 1A13808]RLP52840.1 MAG: DUF2894 domain-containing protein [Ketobacter sp.]